MLHVEVGGACTRLRRGVVLRVSAQEVAETDEGNGAWRDLGIGELSSTAEIADREMSVLWSWSQAAREQGGVRTGRRLSWPRGGCLALILASVRAGDSCCHGARCLLPRGNNISAPPFRVYSVDNALGFSPGASRAWVTELVSSVRRCKHADDEQKE